MQSEPCLSKKAYVANSNVQRAVEQWRETPDDFQMLQRVNLNWLLERDWLSKEGFRAKWIRRPQADQVLYRSAFVTEAIEGRYRPTFLAFCILVAASSKNCSKLMTVCKDIFLKLRKIVDQSGLGHAEIDLEVLTQLIGAPKRTIEQALTLLSDSTLSIHLNKPMNAPPMVSAQGQILQFRNIWEYMAWHVELAKPPSSSFSISDIFNQDNRNQYAQILALVPDGQLHFSRCLDRLNDQPDAAITSARTLVETTLKWVAHDAGHDLEKDESPAKLFERSMNVIGLSPESADGKIGIDSVVRGMDTALIGLAQLRNKRGDSHGRKPGQPAATRRHARLAVLFSIALSTYVIEAREAAK